MPGGPTTPRCPRCGGLLRPDVVWLFDAVFRAGRPQCGRLSPERAAALFGDGAYLAASAALIPLGGSEWRGLLAVGSGDARRFHSGMGTLFLERIGELITQTLQARLLAAGWRRLSDPPSARGG